MPALLPPAAVADVRSGDLPATKTHQRRAWVFVPAADPTAPQLGTLHVRQTKAVTTYLVGLSDDGGELFFAKQDAAAVYAVRLLNGWPAGCTCPGHRFTGHCKHRDAAVEVLAVLAGD